MCGMDMINQFGRHKKLPVVRGRGGSQPPPNESFQATASSVAKRRQFS